MSEPRRATLYRMVMPEHTCPWGLKAKYFLEREGFTVDDHWLRTREETEAFKKEHGVSTTPQTFIDGKRIGGYEDLRRALGKPLPDPKAITYRPVIALFAITALMALAVSMAVFGTPFVIVFVTSLSELPCSQTPSAKFMFSTGELPSGRWHTTHFSL